MNPYLQTTLSSGAKNDKENLVADERSANVTVVNLQLTDKKRWIWYTVIAFTLVLALGFLGGILVGLTMHCPRNPNPPPPTTTTTVPPVTTSTITENSHAIFTDASPSSGKMPAGSKDPFPPPTKRPLPPHPEKENPVSLLYIMEMSPEFTAVECGFVVPAVFKYNVTVAQHTFTSAGGARKHEAKETAAMVANEALFGFKYPFIPTPKSECKVIHRT